MERREASVIEQVNGRSAEDFFLRSITMMKIEWPPWLLQVRKADKHEDENGIDFIASTADTGDVFIQVKSSLAYAIKYMEKHARDKHEICIFIASDSAETLYSIFCRTRTMLRKYRQNKLEGIPQKFLLSSPFRKSLTVLAESPKCTESTTTV
jgi:hypothetical protein